MHSWKRGLALFLLAVMAVGGVVAPVLHSIEHTRVQPHRHGPAATAFTLEEARAAHAHEPHFFVEEHTKVDVLCQLCARQMLQAVLSPLTPTARAVETAPGAYYVRSLPASTFQHFSIRAPPVVG